MIIERCLFCLSKFVILLQLGCRLLHIIKTYFMLSTYFWMLCEGAYLHLLLKYTWGVKPWQMWCLVTAGWTLPAVSIIPYAYCRFDKNMCGITEPINEETERYVNNCFCVYWGCWHNKMISNGHYRCVIISGFLILNMKQHPWHYEYNI